MARRVLYLVLLLLLALPPAWPAGATPFHAGPRPVGPQNTGELRAFWVDAWNSGFKTPAQISQLIADAHTANVNTLIVQVRRRGDAYYNESVEPRATDIPDPAFDPLAALLAAAHNASPPLQVYAWVTTFPVWSDYYSTSDPTRHVYYRHGCGNTCAWDDPENWLSYRYTGGNYVATYDLDPGHPAAARYTVDVCLHLIRHYDIDGLVLDYVRYMGADYGYNKASIDRYIARYGGPYPPDPATESWKAWRREQVTNVVRRLYLEALAVKPDLVLGAATIAWGNGPDQTGGWETTSAYRSVYQDWRGWLEEGIIDLALPMNYDREHQPPQDQYFRNWVEWEKNHQYGRAVAPSPAAYLNHIGGSLVQAAVVQAPSGQGYHALGPAFYSYASTNCDGLPNSEFYNALSHANPYGTPPFPTWVDPPTLPWKTTPTAGHLAGWAIGPTGPLDRAVVQVSGPQTFTTTTDGSGFFGKIDLPPGDYTVVLPAPATSPLYARVEAGRVALATVGAPPAAPALRAVLVDAAHDGFKTPDQVDVLLADARAAHLNAVIVQVRHNGRIYYDSPYEPRADDPELAPGFDPLAYLLQQAHAGEEPIAVYAWLPLLAVWNQDLGLLPPGHVLQEHPEWLSQDQSGNQRSYGKYYLDPGHPGVLTYTVGLVLDLLSRYPVDGLLLDDLLYPYEGSTIGYPIWGYNPVSVARFHTRYGGSGNPPANDAQWMAWRRGELTALLRQIYLRATAAAPRLRIAATAVPWGDSPDYAGGWEQSSAYGRLLQDWRGWLAEGILDLAAPLNYDREYHSSQRLWFDHWLAWEQGNLGRRDVLVLQGAYLNYPEHTLAQAARIPGDFAGFSYYIPANLYADPNAMGYSVQPPRQPWYYSPEAEWWLWRSLALPYGYTDPATGAFTATLPLFPSAAPTPTLPWKDSPTLGHVMGLALGPGLVPMTVPTTITLAGPESRLLQNDGSGFFGAVDLPPGEYLATVSGAASAYRVLAGTVVAGQVTWLQPAVPVTGVAVSGPARLPLGIEGNLTATAMPADASPPITYTWDFGDGSPIVRGPSSVVGHTYDALGPYTIAVTAANCCGTATAEWPVEVFCQEITGVEVEGPGALLVGQTGKYLAAVEPVTASRPLTFTWDNGTVGATALYSWPVTGTYTITMTATNPCGVEQRGTRSVHVQEEWPYRIFLPLVRRPP